MLPIRLCVSCVCGCMRAPSVQPFCLCLASGVSSLVDQLKFTIGSITPPDHPIRKLFIDVCVVTRSNNCTRHIRCRIVRVDLLSSPPPLEPWPWCRGGCRPSLLSVYIVLLLNFHQWLIFHVLHRHKSSPLSKQFDYCLLHIRLYMIACPINDRIDTPVSNRPLLKHCLVPALCTYYSSHFLWSFVPSLPPSFSHYVYVCFSLCISPSLELPSQSNVTCMYMDFPLPPIRLSKEIFTRVKTSLGP